MSGSAEDHKLLKSVPRVTLLPSHNNQLNDQGVANVVTSGAQENVDCLWTPEEVALFCFLGSISSSNLMLAYLTPYLIVGRKVEDCRHLV